MAKGGTNSTAIELFLHPELSELKKTQEMLARTAANAVTVFSKRGYEAFMKHQRAIEKAQRETVLEIAALESKLSNAALTAYERNQIQSTLLVAKLRKDSLEKEFKQQLAKDNKIVARRTKAMESVSRSKEAMKGAGDLAQKFGEELSGAFQDITSKDLGRMFQGPLTKMGTLFNKAGEGLMRKAGPGTVGSAMGGLGSLLAKIGPALAAIGALAAGFAALMKIVIDADAQAKELNKTLLDSGMAAGEISDEFGMVGDKINVVRKTFTKAFDFNRIWGTTAKDHLAILGAYAGAGLTFKEITQNTQNARMEMERLRDATATTLTYAKLFGVESQAMAGNIAEYMEELGQNFEGIKEGLSAIHIAAKDSGFGVKRFYSMVLQATSGMSMYNVRLEEAGGLLIRLGKVLGSKMGGDFLQQLTKGFGDKSMQDRYKQVLTTGKGKMKGIYERSAGATSEDFMKKFNKWATSSDMGSATGAKRMADAFAKAGKTGVSMDPKQMVKDLAKLDSEEQEKLLAEARLSGNDDLVRQLSNLMQVTRGTTGKTGEMAKGLGGLDMGGKLSAMLNMAAGVIKAPLHEMSVTQLMAFESMTGISGEQLEILRRVDESMYGNWNKLQEMAKDNKAISEEEKKIQIKAYGAYADSGKIFAARLGEDGEIQEASIKELSGTVEDYIQGQGDVFAKAAKEGVPADTQLAQDIASNTTEMTKILEQGVEWWLETIAGLIESFMNRFLDKREREARQGALTQLSGGMKSEREVKKSLEKKIAKKQAERVSETAEGKAKIDSDIEGLRKEIDLSDKRFSNLAKQRENLMRNPAQVGYKGGTTPRNTQDFLYESKSGSKDIETARQEQLEELLPDKEIREKAVKIAEKVFVGAALSELAGGLSKEEYVEQAAEKARLSAQKTAATRVMDQGGKTKTDLERPGLLLQGERTSVGQKVEKAKADAEAQYQLFETQVEQNKRSAAVSGLLGDKAYLPSARAKQQGFQGIGGMLGAKVKSLTTGKEISWNEGMDKALADAGLLTKESMGQVLKTADTAAQAKKKQQEKELHTKEVPNIMQARFEEALKKNSEREMALEFQATMSMAGKSITEEEAGRAVKELRQGGIMPDALTSYLETPVGSEGKTLREVLQGKGFPVMNDFVSQGGRVFSIDAADVLTGAKPGGPIAKAGGGGGTKIYNYHLYGEGPGTLNTITKAQQSGMLN